MRRVDPDRSRWRSSTYRKRSAPPAGVPLRAMRTVSVEAVCAPARGERINRCGAGALAGFVAVLAWVAAGARVAAVVVEVPPPQPLATRTNPKLTQTDPALNTLIPTLLPSVAAILVGNDE